MPCALDVDWLFVVDDSNSMEEEQAALSREIPRLVEILVTGDGNGDGIEDFAPVRSVHLGIITSDLGAGEHLEVSTCARGWGGDGRLRRGIQISASCAGLEVSDGIFSFGPEDDADARIAFADDFACAARAGLGGCGFEQPLEATLRALAPSEPTAWTAPGYEPIVFRDGSSGHALDANAGFLRDDSVLAITLLSDEEDCSTPDTSLYVSGDPRFASVPLNLRCEVFSELEYPTERYVRGLASLRPDPRLLVFSAITGVPPGTYVTAAQYEQVLRDPRMEARANELGLAVAPVCESVHGTAAPARRTLLVAADLQRRGALTSVSSICSRSYESAVSDIVRALARARATCR